MESVIFTITSNAIDGKDSTLQEVAALFVADLFRMYTIYAEDNYYDVNLFEVKENECGGFDRITFSMAGNGVGILLQDHGVHSNTEINPYTKLRTTIFAMVEIIKEPNEPLNSEEVALEIFRYGFAAGTGMRQGISCKATHIPTGIAAVCEESMPTKDSIVKGYTLRLLNARVNSTNEPNWSYMKRRYVRDPYTMVKSIDTQKETDQLREVLNGDLGLVLS